MTSPDGPWPFSGRGALLLLFFSLLASLASSLLSSGSARDWPVVFGLHAVFCFWVVAVLLACWWLCDRWWPRVPAWLFLLGVFALPVLITLSFSLLVVGLQEFPLPIDADWWVLRNGLVSLAMACLLVFYVAVQQQWRQRQAAESERRLDALQARIAPHFLFNTLNTLTELVHERPDEAEQAMLDMADLLRTALRGASSHTLADELELVRGYLRIEALRLGDRLRVDWSLPEDLPGQMALPALVLQPLVENAIVHGVARCAEPGPLRISAERRRFGRWQFVVENPLPETAEPAAEGSLALDNIRQRLALAYDDEADLRLRSDQHNFRAELIVPDRPSGQA